MAISVASTGQTHIVLRSPKLKEPAVNARDRIGKGPWYNAEGLLIAANLSPRVEWMSPE